MSVQSEELLRKLYKRLQEIKAENEHLKQIAAEESIAIVGVGCRLPGNVNSVDEFGDRLAAGTTFANQMPDTRPSFGGTAKSHWCSSLVENVGDFDAEFFGLSAAEAAETDPQQRLLLEVAYHALEDSCYPANELRGQHVGVFIGLGTDDYQLQALSKGDNDKVNPYSILGTGRAVAAGRIAYFFGFTGPTLQVDTTCSSSLTAIHLACNSLRLGEVGMALAGGVALNLGQQGYALRDAVKKISPTGKCNPFSSTADGFTRGEGCGIVVLKRLSAAVRDGDHVHAVIYASTVNNNGRSNGMTAPNGEAQRQLMRSTLRKARLQATDIDFIEPHGTASLLGDTIEAHAIGDVLAGDRETPLWLGSMKSRLGHLEAAAGVAAIVKICAMLSRESILPDAPIAETNSTIDWDRYAMRFPEKQLNWPRNKSSPRRACINAFGLSGTNVNLVIGDPPEEYIARQKPETRLPLLLCVSGKTQSSYRQNIEVFSRRACDNDRLNDLAIGSMLYKEHFDYRKSFIADGSENMKNALVEAKNIPLVPKQSGPIAFYFGSDGWSLAVIDQLYREFPMFRERVDKCLQNCAGEPVGTSWLKAHQADLRPEAISSIGDYAIAMSLQALGVEPDFLFCSDKGVLTASAFAGLINSVQMIHPAKGEVHFSSKTSDIERSRFPMILATTKGLSSLDSAGCENLKSLLEKSTTWPTGKSLPVEQVLCLANCLLESPASHTLKDNLPIADDMDNIVQRFIATIGKLFDFGYNINFSQLYPQSRCVIDPPPLYQFDRTELWAPSN